MCHDQPDSTRKTLLLLGTARASYGKCESCSRADVALTDLRVPVLAARVGMSPRNFALEMGLTPGAYVDQLRLEAARRMLEESSATLKQIAAAAGFGTMESLRRAFTRATGSSPSAHRARFRAAQGVRMGLGVL
jgi:AraC-like DNA-binding protein